MRPNCFWVLIVLVCCQFGLFVSVFGSSMRLTNCWIFLTEVDR